VTDRRSAKIRVQKLLRATVLAAIIIQATEDELIFSARANGAPVRIWALAPALLGTAMDRLARLRNHDDLSRVPQTEYAMNVTDPGAVATKRSFPTAAGILLGLGLGG
jgi:hypothetical protein